MERKNFFKNTRNYFGMRLKEPSTMTRNAKKKFTLTFSEMPKH